MYVLYLCTYVRVHCMHSIYVRIHCMYVHMSVCVHVMFLCVFFSLGDTCSQVLE